MLRRSDYLPCLSLPKRSASSETVRAAKHRRTLNSQQRRETTKSGEGIAALQKSQTIPPHATCEPVRRRPVNVSALTRPLEGTSDMNDQTRPDPTAGVRAGYDRWAAVYDHDANPLQALEEPLVRAAVGDARGLAVLDLGCGTGRHALWLAAGGAAVTAVDFSEGMLAEARRKPGAGGGPFPRPRPAPAAAVRPTRRSTWSSAAWCWSTCADLAAFFARGPPGAPARRPGGRVGHAPGDVPARRSRRGSPTRRPARWSGPAACRTRSATFVMAAVRAGLPARRRRGARARRGVRRPRIRARAKYVGWPMLVVLRLGKVN